MLYHVIRRSPHNNNKNHNINSSTNSTSSYEHESIPTLMSRYHYSRVNIPHSATASSESFFPRQTTKTNMTTAVTPTTTTSNHNNNSNSYSSFKSTFIPLVTNIRTMTPNKREFIQIPITREDGTPVSNNPVRSVPITFITETAPLPTTATNNNTNNNNNNNSGPATYSRSLYTNLLRPGSRYTRHHHSIGSGDDSSITNVPRLPTVPRRLSLTSPILTNSCSGSKSDDETAKPTVPSSPTIRQIPIQFSQQANNASTPSNTSRISSAVLRSSSLSHPPNSQLKRQKTDLGDISSSDFASTLLNTSPVRRAEAMARAAIQGVVRFQQQQQQRNDPLSDNNMTNHLTSIRSPGLSRRVIVNLKTNPPISLDSRLSSANSSFSRSSPNSSLSRLQQRNNFYHVPILQEIQMSSHSTAATPTELSSPLIQSPLIVNRKILDNNNCFKNEVRMEIPIQVMTTNEQENSIEDNEEKDDGILDYDQSTTIIAERAQSANVNSNQTLKSILKRSSSRDNVPRKNVSFMNV